MYLRVLGPIELDTGNGIVRFPGHKLPTVAAALALAERPVSGADLSLILWGAQCPPTAAAQVYNYVSRLRAIFGHRVPIFRSSGHYRLEPGALPLDACGFLEDVESARRAAESQDYEPAIASFDRALARWRGPALANATDPMRARWGPEFDDLRLAATEERFECLLATGHHRAVVPKLITAVAEAPDRDRLRAQLMIALHRSDRSADALRVYEERRRFLAERFGVSPGPLLARVHQTVLRGEPNPARRPSAAPGSLPRPAPAAQRPVMLPPAQASCHGRARQRQLLLDWCARVRTKEAPSARVAVVCGFPGVGTSTFLLDVARRISDDFPDGTLYANLREDDGSMTPRGQIMKAFLSRLGCPGSPESDTVLQANLAAAFRSRRLLIVLDNVPDPAAWAAFVPSEAGSVLMMSSRKEQAPTSGALMVKLGRLVQSDAREILSDLVGSGRVAAEPEAEADLLRWCEGLPRLVDLVGRRLSARPGCTLSMTAERLADEATLLSVLSWDGNDAKAILLEQLATLGPLERRILADCARLGIAELRPDASTAQQLRLQPGMVAAAVEELMAAELVDMIDSTTRSCRLKPLTKLGSRLLAEAY